MVRVCWRTPIWFKPYYEICWDADEEDIRDCRRVYGYSDNFYTCISNSGAKVVCSSDEPGVCMEV